MAKILDLQEFLDTPGVIMDVRSPCEYNQGRIPGALSFPLFSDSERAAIGTAYKQIGRKEAVAEGLELTAPKASHLIAQAAAWTSNGSKAKVHCWRGGMRSYSLSLLLEMAQIDCVTLQGGYKAYRRWALKSFDYPYKLCLIGGMTGSGKTSILQALREHGEQILDLEMLAGHRGSSFGMIGLPPQPSNEQFENEIAAALKALNPAARIWVEDESRMIGACKIPDKLFEAMQSAALLLVGIPLEERVSNLQKDYWQAAPADLIAGIERLSKKLGGVKTKQAVRYIQDGDLRSATLLLLTYYDSAYGHSLKKRQGPVRRLTCEGLSACQWAERLIRLAESARLVPNDEIFACTMPHQELNLGR